MSDNEDDYLSDKFVADTVAEKAAKPLTYGQRRQRAIREAELKNVINRRKSRRELEEESRREGLSKSLFERVKEDEQTGKGQVNSKAMGIMLKMGFKPGNPLGNIEETPTVISPGTGDPTKSVQTSGHLVDPLNLDVWSGRLGVGKRKRAASPVAADPAKVSRQSDEAHGSYRERAKHEYEERRAEGRLVAATRSCITLDEAAGKTFNVYWLDPRDPESFPPDLLESITSELDVAETLDTTHTKSYNDYLRQQMRTEALTPLSDIQDETDPPRPSKPEGHLPPRLLEEAGEFIRLSAQRRLDILLAYMRREYFYCFWCGTQYTDLEDLQHSCPGATEEDHD